jgi:hypothetical protein
MPTPRKIGAYVFQWHYQYWGQTRCRLISWQTWWLLANDTPYHSTNFSTRTTILEISERDSKCYVITLLRSLSASFFSLSSSFQFNFHTLRCKFTWPSPYQENYDLRSGMLLSATVSGRYIFKPTHLFIHSLTHSLTHECSFICAFHVLSNNYLFLHNRILAAGSYWNSRATIRNLPHLPTCLQHHTNWSYFLKIRFNTIFTFMCIVSSAVNLHVQTLN